MGSQLIISGETGGTPPYSFYVCDEYMNNCFLLGPSGGTYTLNSFFSTAQTLIIKIVDSTGCFNFKYVYCFIDTFFILTEDGLIITTESGDELVWI
jgi:hypothetical protein